MMTGQKSRYSANGFGGSDFGGSGALTEGLRTTLFGPCTCSSDHAEADHGGSDQGGGLPGGLPMMQRGSPAPGTEGVTTGLTDDQDLAGYHTAVMKWFDHTRGFGFATTVHGDVLVHHSVLRPHGRRSLPDGARLSCRIQRGARGLNAAEVSTFDLSSATVADAEVREDARRNRVDPRALLDDAGPFEPVVFKWLNRLKGYGFVKRVSDDADVFLHMETVRHAGLQDIEADQGLLARIASGAKGLLVVVLQPEGGGGALDLSTEGRHPAATRSAPQADEAALENDLA